MGRCTVAQFANRIKRVLSPTLVNDLGRGIGFYYLRPTRVAGSTPEWYCNRSDQPCCAGRSEEVNAQKSAALARGTPGKPVRSTARPNIYKVLTPSSEGLGKSVS